MSSDNLLMIRNVDYRYQEESSTLFNDENFFHMHINFKLVTSTVWVYGDERILLLFVLIQATIITSQGKHRAKLFNKINTENLYVQCNLRNPKYDQYHEIWLEMFWRNFLHIPLKIGNSVARARFISLHLEVSRVE